MGCVNAKGYLPFAAVRSVPGSYHETLALFISRAVRTIRPPPADAQAIGGIIEGSASSHLPVALLRVATTSGGSETVVFYRGGGRNFFSKNPRNISLPSPSFCV